MLEIVGIGLLAIAGIHGYWGHMVPWKGGSVKGVRFTAKAVGLAVVIALGEILLAGASTFTILLVNGIALGTTIWQKEKLQGDVSKDGDAIADGLKTAAKAKGWGRFFGRG